MRELTFYPVSVPLLLVEDGAGHGSESVPGEFVFAVPHAPDGGVRRHVRHGTVFRSNQGEKPPAISGVQCQFAEHGNGLPRERNYVKAGNFHLLGGDFPFFPFEVDLLPFGFPQFSGADEGVRLELQRASTRPLWRGRLWWDGGCFFGFRLSWLLHLSALLWDTCPGGADILSVSPRRAFSRTFLPSS